MARAAELCLGLRRALAPLLLLAVALCGCASQDRCALVQLAQAKLQTGNRLMVVTAGINGQWVRMLVDTGAERTLLTETAVKRLGLGRDLHQTRSIGIGGMSASWDASVPGIVLGETRFPLERVAVGRFEITTSFEQPIDGLLGADILLAFDLDIDQPAGQLTLYRVRRCPDARPPWPGPAMEIADVNTRRDRMLVPITVDGASGMAVLDTGAQLSAVSLDLAQRAGVSRERLAADPQITLHGAAPQSTRVSFHRFHALHLGPEQISSPRLAVVPNFGGLGDGVIGGDFIRGRRIWLSFATGRLFVAGPDTP